MAKPRTTSPIDYQSLESRDLVWLAQMSDRQAEVVLLARKEEVMRRLVRNCVRKYTFVDPDDLYQSLVLSFFKIVRTYRPGKKTDWDKYCYHRLTFSIKDILRQRDDLGICWPQKKQYPEWYHLYDTTKADARDGNHADSISDHRYLADSDREWLEFYESIEHARQAFSTCLCKPRERVGKPAVHELLPIAWTSGDDGIKSGYFFPDQCCAANTKRRRSVRVDLSRWRMSRSKPKQMVMF